MFTRIKNLQDDGIVDDLREAIEPNVRHRHLVQVREKMDDNPLREDAPLKAYFAIPQGSAGVDGPGKSRDSALFVQLPEQQQQLVCNSDLGSTVVP